jgi:hypothetical protein
MIAVDRCQRRKHGRAADRAWIGCGTLVFLLRCGRSAAADDRNVTGGGISWLDKTMNSG